MRALIALLSIFLVSCATSVKPIIGPDGSTHQLVSCLNVESCYEKAREICNGTYKVINTSAETSGSNGSTGTMTKLLVKCDK